MKDWREEYQRKLISAEVAAKKVKSGDKVAFTLGREGLAIGLAIAARKEELRDVKILDLFPGYDFGWYDEGWQDSFQVTVAVSTAICEEALAARRIDFNPFTMAPGQEGAEEVMSDFFCPDILITEVSPPDEKGFCSFGNSLWNKRRHIKTAKLVIAEVNENLIRTYGDNFVHISEIDYFVEHITRGGEPGKLGSLAGREVKEPEPYFKDIAGYVRELIRDRDTLQIGVGRTTEPLVGLGMLEGKSDLGYHSEATPPGIISKVREGVINGRYKTINPDKAIVTSLGGGTREEMMWANNNPAFHLVDVWYLEDPRVISAHDNMVAINNALIVDLTGQIGAETLGATRIFNSSGGQIAFVVGATLSKGGRCIHVLTSTAKVKGEPISRIVPVLPEGTVVTTHRCIADYIVTEYGIARVKGKTLRQRVNELIAIAHPDFRAELKEQAQKYYL